MTNSEKSPFAVKWGMFIIPLLVAVILFAPMLAPSNQFFNDWVNGYWLTLAASDSPVWPQWFFGPINGLPALEPWFAYYGGNWFYLLAYIGEFWDNPLLLYRASYILLAIGMAFGIYFLSLRANAGIWASALLASVSLSFPYYLTNAFGRGAYTEFVFVSLVPMFIAACVAFLTGRRLWQLSVAAVLAVGTATLLLNTHVASLIMVFDLAIVIGILGALVPFYLIATRLVDLEMIVVWIRKYWRSIAALGLLVSAALLVALPQLGATLFTASGTKLGLTNATCEVPELSTLPEVFAFAPQVHAISTTPDLKPQTATWLAVWAVGMVVLSWPRFGPWRRLALMLAICLLAFSIAMASSTWLCRTLPDWIVAFQFPYRFVTYINYSLLLICGVLLSSRVLRRGRSRLRTVSLSLFVAVSAITLVLAYVQTRQAATYPEQADLTILTPNEFPPTWYAPSGSFRKLGQGSGKPTELDIDSQTSFSVVATVECTGSDHAVINVADSRPLISIGGTQVVGSSEEGLLVIDTSSCPRGDRLGLTIEQASEREPWRSLIIVALLIAFVQAIIAVRLALVEGRRRAKQP